MTQEPELVISGWENGAADSPHLGLADMKNINNDSFPGIALCNLKLQRNSSLPVTATAFTANVGASTISFSGSLGIAGRAVIFTGADLPDPLVAGTVYYLETAGTGSKIYATKDPFSGLGSQVTLNDAGSGVMTFATVNITIPKDWIKDYVNGTYYIIDNVGRTWFTDAEQSWSPLKGNNAGSGAGIAIFKNYLITFDATSVSAYRDNKPY